MSSSHRYSPLFALIFVFFFCASSLAQQFSVKFKVDSSKIIVPVAINGTGPYNFILDTGNSDMTVDSKLVAELNLPNAGSVTVLAAEGAAVASIVRLDSVLMDGAIVRNINSSVIKEVPFHARGVLGEGFLRNFDLLIDNRRHVIEFESGPGHLLDVLTGERTSFLTHGVDRGHVTSKRVIVCAHIFELGEREFRLLLDSGSDAVLVFARLEPNSRPRDSAGLSTLGAYDGAGSNRLRINRLQVGNDIVPSVTAVAPVVLPRSDVDGLLPTSLFHSVFISHSGEFIILNPAVKAQIAPETAGRESGLMVKDVRE